MVIRTNSASAILTIDAEHDTVSHYGEAGFLNIIKVDTASYHEHGYIPQAQIAYGHIINEAGEVELEDGTIKKAGVENLFIVAATEGSGETAGTFSDVIVEAAQGAEVPALDRSDVNIVGAVLVVEVKTATTDDFVYLTKSGIVEQVVVTTEKNAESATAKAGSDSSLNATASKAADEIANIAKRGANGRPVKADGTTEMTVEEVAALTSVEEIKIAEPKATKADLEKSQGENALFAFGTGSKSNPFGISNSREFNNIEIFNDEMIQQSSRKYYFIQIKDIEFVDDDIQYFNSTQIVDNFSGYYDGGNHTLSVNMNINNKIIYLFGELTWETEIVNLTTVSKNNVALSIAYYDHYNHDAFAEGYTRFKNITTDSIGTIDVGNRNQMTLYSIYGPWAHENTFENCTNNANITTSGNCIGAFAGAMYGSYGMKYNFINCTNKGNLSATSSAGVISGHSYPNTWENINEQIYIENLINTGTIRATVHVGVFSEPNTSDSLNQMNALCENIGKPSNYILNKELSGEFSLSRDNKIELVTTNTTATTFKLRFMFGSIEYSYGVSNQTSFFIDIEKVNEIVSEQSIEKIHGYDKKKALELGIITNDTKFDFYCSYYKAAIVYGENGNLYIILDNSNADFTCDTKIYVSVFGYDNNENSVGYKDLS